MIETVVEHMPPGSTLALASRTEPERLPVGRLRAERRLVELRLRDLVMTRAEATLLLVGLGLRPAAEMPTRCDAVSIRFRRWLTARGTTYGAIV